jgi:hypothetical protein
MLPAPLKNSKIVTSVKLGIKGLVPIDIRSMIIPTVMTGLRPILCVIMQKQYYIGTGTHI